MARYIDLDKAIQDVESVGAYYSEEEQVKEQCLFELKEQPIADVVPRSEVERLTVELEAMRGAANSYKMHYEKAKQEVASDIFNKLLSHTSIGIRWLKELISETESEEDETHLKGRLAELCNTERVVAELEKKYIGE